MTKQKLLIIAVVALLFINLAMTAFLLLNRPQFPMRGQPPERGPRNMIVAKLRFDQQQEQAYNLLIEEHKKNMQSLEKDVRRVKDELYRTLVNESGRQEELIEELGSLQMAIERAHYLHFEGIKIICTPEQLVRFNELADQLATFFARKKDQAPPRDMDR